MNRLECRTCPYEYAITEPLYSRRVFTRREREDVFGGPGAWDNAQKGKVQCPAEGCDGAEAAFFQVQIRSADEPMTSFFKVRRCVFIFGLGGEPCRRSFFFLPSWLTIPLCTQCMTCGHRWREN